MPAAEAARSSALYLTQDGERQALPSKLTNLRLSKGDIIRLETSGGGGFGNPEDRSSELIKRDVRQGYVSADSATKVFGLATG